MNAVFEKTRELGDALMASEEYQAMKAAEDAAMANEEAASLMSEYLEHKTRLEEILHSGNPDPDAVSQLGAAMEDVQGRFQAVPDIIAMNRAREEFDNLINQVNQVLHFIITGEMEQSEGSGCTGSCATCPGCH
ncbi:MAG: YlbF family regulator [Clostridia bacterium]|nr:YlbF family regulator [Clostridia bacterium]